MKKKGQKIDGWLVLDKAPGMTSTQAVAKIKYLFQAQKVGHAGTLDPLASGILPIALGEATKTVAHIMDSEKLYHFTLVFGEARSTDDAEGEILARSDRRPDDQAIQAALPRFTGRISQLPPVFSALKLQGKRAYDLARAGEEVKLEPREVEVWEFRLLERIDENRVRFEVKSGKGVYIRSLARDLAQYLGSCGYAADLRRLRVGPFREEMAISLDRLGELMHSAAAFKHLLPIETALDDIPALALTAPEARSLQSGNGIGWLGKPDMARLPDIRPGQVVRAMYEGKLLALVCLDEGRLKPVRVMNL